MRKREKNNAFFSLATIIGWLMLGIFCAESAHAVVPITVPIDPHQTTTGNYSNNGVNSLFPRVVNPSDGAICPIDVYGGGYAAKLANKAKWGLAKRVVTCVKGVIIPATLDILNAYFVYFKVTINVACTLALIFWGYMMVTGKHSAPTRDAFIIAIKIGCVILFTNTLGAGPIWPDGLYPVLLDIVDDLILKVSSYAYYSTQLPCAKNVTPGDMWALVDCMLETLIGGILAPSSLMAGLVGFFTSALVSGSFGLFIAAAGFAIILILFYAVIRAIYIVITAYVAISLMAIISPIFITCILFSATRAYFEKWLKLLIGFMLQPIFLFAYISMLLVAYDTVVYKGPFSIYRAIAGNAVDQPNFQMGQWLYGQGIYKEASASSIGVGVDPKRDAYIKDHNIGTLGTTGEKPLDPNVYKSIESQNVLGNFVNVIDQFGGPAGTPGGINVYKLDIPVKRISWYTLALAKNQARAGNVGINQADKIRIGFLVDLLLSLIIAALTVYMFYLLLDLLPFIGAGISGETLSMPTLGKGKLSMPGNSWLEKLKSSTMGATGGGAST